jgi:hypothetical protein
MRRLLALLVLSFGLVAAPASAQSLRDVLGAVTGVRNATTFGGCSYQRGVSGALCQVRRASSTMDGISRTRRQFDDARRRDATSVNLRDANPRVVSELSGLCRRGDDEACNAIRAMRRQDETRRVDLLDRSVISACANGDDLACDRLRRSDTRQNATHQDTAPRNVYRQAPAYAYAGR